MEEVVLMTGLFVAGAGAGALLSYARDRNLLRLYGHLVHDLSSMIPHDDQGPPEFRPPPLGSLKCLPSSRRSARQPPDEDGPAGASQLRRDCNRSSIFLRGTERLWSSGTSAPA